MDLGPITNKKQLDRILTILNTVENEGGKIMLDGRSVKVPKYENGYFVGPSVLTNLTTSMTAYKEEIFGPVLCALSAKSLDEAIELINK